MPKPPQTSPGTSRLSDIARHVVRPSGITATAWPSVKQKCADLGIEFDSWQDGAGRLILSKRADGQYATTVGGVVISIPRQVGKTFLLGAIVFALCLLHPNLTVIWTAHRLRTAGETFTSMQGMARRKKIAAHVDRIVLGSGDEEIRFKNGSRILFGARERGFGLGFSEVDVLVFDEAQRLSEAAIDDMVPTTNQAPNPLILFTGTPPRPTDSGEVFRQKRNEALSGESDDAVYIEFSADPDASTDDWSQVAKANPSYPTRTPRAAILRMKKNLTPDSYLREALGIWDVMAKSQVMPSWLDRGVDIAGRAQPEPLAIGIAVSVDRAWASIGVVYGGEKPHLAPQKRARGVDWVVAEAARIREEYRIPVAIHGRGPGASLIEPLKEAGIDPIVAGIDDYQDACAELFDRVEARTVEHGHYDDLNDAVAVAGWTSGERRVWSRKSGDVSMLEAVTLALWVSEQVDSVYETRGMVIL